jgi:tetratricopeptide (TPR) repeat protein
MKSTDPAPLLDPPSPLSSNSSSISASVSPSASISSGTAVSNSNSSPCGSCSDVSSGSSGRILLAILLLVVLVTGSFANALRNPLLNWDDQVYIQDNPYIRTFSWSNLKALFTQPYFKNYAPIHILSYQLDYHLFRLRPEGYRMVNILLHIINSILVFFLIMEWYHTFEASLIAAAIYAVHTIHVESVVWLSQRKDVLSAFFFLLSLYAYTQFRKRKESFGVQDSGGKVQHTDCGVRSAGCGVRCAGCGVRDAGCEVRGADCEVRGADCEVRGAGCEVRDAGCVVRDAGCVAGTDCELPGTDCGVQGTDRWPTPADRCPPATDYRPLSTDHRMGGAHTAWYGVSLGVFLLALLTKAIAVTLPLILVLHEFCFQKEKSAIRWKDKIPFFLLACFGAVATCWAQGVDSGIKRYVGHSFFLSLLLTGKILVLYLEKLLVPLGLSNRYVFLVTKPSDLLTPSLALSWAILLLFLGGLAVLWREGKKDLAFPCLWFLITLLPVANLVPTSTQMADRYLYLPSLGYGLAIGLMVYAFGQWAGQRKKGKLLHAAAILLTAGLVIFYGSLTWARNRVWRSDRSLWEDALATDTNNYHAAAGLANTYLIEAQRERNPRQKEQSLKQASQLLQQAIRIKPDFSLAHFEMGSVLIEEGKVKEAIPLLLQASRENDEKRYAPLIEHNLGIAYLRAESLCGTSRPPCDSGQIKAAEKAFASALRQDPGFAPAYLSLGTIYFGYGTPQGYRMAKEQYQRAIEASPEEPCGYFYLALTKERLGDFLTAIDDYQQALRLIEDRPSSSVGPSVSINPADIHLNLAGLYYRLQDRSKAVEHYRQVLHLDPNHVQAEAVRSMLLSLGCQ